MEKYVRLVEEMDYNYYIGYSQNIGYILIVTFIFLSIIMNMIFILNYIVKKFNNKKDKKISSLETILFLLSILECTISSLWAISALVYPKKSYMSDKSNEICIGCRIIGILQTFFYIFDWILSVFTMYHLINMILNPLKFILKPFKKILLYTIISGGIAAILTTLSVIFNIIGISPMITCFLSLKDIKEIKSLGSFVLLIIFLIPIISFLLFIVHVIIIVRNPSYQSDTENKRIFKDHSSYTFINHVITLLMISLYVIYFIKEGNLQNGFDLWYFYFATLIINFNPLIVGIIRLKQTGNLRIIINKLCPRCKKRELLLTESLLTQDDNELKIEKFEMSAVKKFVMNIYISICYCLEKYNSQQKTKNEIDQNTCNETNEYTISKSVINKDVFMNKIANDILVKNREDFSISCVEYAPKIFAYLRQLDSIKEEDIVNSLLPKNNTNGIRESEGKGGSLFLNTDDNEFIIKTITFNEAELIRSLLLCRLADYLTTNNDSIISRIYGVYKISIKTGLFEEDEYYFIMMKNVLGSFADNFICKFDLKGSSLNREEKIGEYGTNVMKDTDFKNYEKVLYINENNANKLINIVTKDANFFSDLGVMDYSLLILKVSLYNDEVTDLFGKLHRRQSEREYKTMLGMNEKNENDESKDNNENEEMINEYHDEKIDNTKIRYKKNKIKPLRKYFFPHLKGDGLYIISIIDFLQLYNFQKNLETKLKLLKYRVPEEAISSMPPNEYKDRFIENVKKITNTKQYLKEVSDNEVPKGFEVIEMAS